MIEAGSEIDEKDLNGYTPFKTAIDMEYKRVAGNPSNHHKCQNIVMLFKEGARIGNVDFGIDKKRKMNLLKKCIGGNNVKIHMPYKFI